MSKEDATIASAKPMRGEDPTLRGPRMAKWSPDGTMLAVAGEDNNVRVFKLQQNGVRAAQRRRPACAAGGLGCCAPQQW